MIKKLFGTIGPGTLIAAAFIGPGTVTVCTLAGVQYNFTLLWAMVLSIIATIVLQEMAARLGLVTQKGLAATVKDEIKIPLVKTVAILLILSAILVGNAAYEAGNISGGVLGLQTIFTDTTFFIGSFEFNYLTLLVGALAFALLYTGNYKLIERSLVTLVILMSISFLLTAVMTKPNFMAVLQGMFVPVIPQDGLYTVIALVGTTVVPYNLFLHASLVKERWKDVEDLKIARKDTYISIVLGGVVSIAIIVCAAAVENAQVQNASHLAKGLEPLFGTYATYFLSAGLFAAGITSAITAPLAAAYVAKETFGWNKSLKTLKFRMVWMSILGLGVLLASAGWKPIEIIKFAQITNAILLPIIAGFLLWLVNRSGLLGKFRNTKFQNILGALVVLTTLMLGLRGLIKVFS